MPTNSPSSSITPPISKRKRRAAWEIDRQFKCEEVAHCNKKYGSASALRTHVKKKHPERLLFFDAKHFAWLQGPTSPSTSPPISASASPTMTKASSNGDSDNKNLEDLETLLVMLKKQSKQLSSSPPASPPSQSQIVQSRPPPQLQLPHQQPLQPQLLHPFYTVLPNQFLSSTINHAAMPLTGSLYSPTTAPTQALPHLAPTLYNFPQTMPSPSPPQSISMPIIKSEEPTFSLIEIKVIEESGVCHCFQHGNMFIRILTDKDRESFEWKVDNTNAGQVIPFTEISSLNVEYGTETVKFQIELRKYNSVSVESRKIDLHFNRSLFSDFVCLVQKHNTLRTLLHILRPNPSLR